MFLYNYEFLLTILAPKVDEPCNFIELRPEIESAVTTFNRRFSDKKSLEILDVVADGVLLKMGIIKLPQNPTKELSAFSQVLVNDFDFQRYSSKQGRLFKIETLSKPEADLSPEEFNDIMRLYERKPFFQTSYYESEAEVAATRCDIVEEVNGINGLYGTKPRITMSEDVGEFFLQIINWMTATDDMDKLDMYLKQFEHILELGKFIRETKRK